MSLTIDTNTIKSNLDNLDLVNSSWNSTKLIAVSKTFSPQTIINGKEAGLKVFGESYAQEAKQKYEYLNEKKIEQPEWHFIGHLQRNKVKYIAPFVDFIHSVDSVRLAQEIDKQAKKNNRTINILIQFNTSGEESKFGAEPKNSNELISDIMLLNNIRIVGLMTITGLKSNQQEKEKEFKILKSLLNDINSQYELDLTELSMGMSSDYKIAIENGSTMVRIGSAIFGEREYKK